MTADPLDLDSIQARADATTPGRWAWRHFADDPENVCRVVHYPDDGDILREPWVVVADDIDDEYDAEFIAAARTDIPALVAECRALRGEVERLTDKRTPTDMDLETLLPLLHWDASTEVLVEALRSARAALAESQAEVERLREHSVTLNRVGWLMAEALGDVPEGVDRINADAIEQVTRLAATLAERDATIAAVKSLVHDRDIEGHFVPISELVRVLDAHNPTGAETTCN